MNLVLAQILRAADEQRFATVVYCFMPDHLHLLIEGQTDQSDCRQFISRSKQYSGFNFARSNGQRLWRRYGYERVLRPEETTLVTARYILNNPVRAGLVVNAEDYPFLGSTTHSVADLLEGVQDGVDHF